MVHLRAIRPERVSKPRQTISIGESRRPHLHGEDLTATGDALLLT
jgi:hypothetical protein